MDEIAALTPTFAGVSYAKLDELGSVQWPCNEKAPEGTPVMHIDGFVRGKGKFVVTEYIPTDERTGPRFPLLLTTGRILSQYNVGAQTRRTENVVWHGEDRLEIHPHDAEQRGVRDGDWVRLASRAGETTLRALITDRVAPGVVYTTFHHPDTQANVITTDYSDWATNCPEYKVTAVQISPSNGPSDWQKAYDEQARHSRRIAPVVKPRSNAMHDPVRTVDRQVWRDGSLSEGTRLIPEETALALTYNGGTYAVMMGTPQDLRGFRHRLQPQRRHRAVARRHRLARHRRARRRHRTADVAGAVEGRTPQRAAAAYRRPHRLRPLRHRFDRGGRAARRDRRRTAARSRRARSWRRWRPSRRCRRSTSRPARCMPRRSGRRRAASSRLREDVGRHNALDKLAGALAQAKIAASEGMVLLTSRVSVEMVQKTAAIGAPLMVAVSAPTALAVRMADAAGITLVAIARADGFEIFTHPDRIAAAEIAHRRPHDVACRRLTA